MTGVVIALNSVEEARIREQAENLDIRFDEGDAEMLSFEDGVFDLVVSLFARCSRPSPSGSRLNWYAYAGPLAA